MSCVGKSDTLQPPSNQITSRHQITIPPETLRANVLKVGERLVARVESPDYLVLERSEDLLAEYAGVLTGAYKRDALDRL
jgi:bifunctional DNA-binding transcriptional regulator/antitoxin component of YhaV-PrlF toxin-antitoxin module